MRSGKLNFADAALRAAAKPANVVRDLEQTHGNGFQMTACFDNGVLSALRFEMIFGLVKRDTGRLLQVPQHFLWKIDVPVQARADGSSAQRKLA